MRWVRDVSPRIQRLLVAPLFKDFDALGFDGVRADRDVKSVVVRPCSLDQAGKRGDWRVTLIGDPGGALPIGKE